MERERLAQLQKKIYEVMNAVGTMRQPGYHPPLRDVVNAIAEVSGVLAAFIDERIADEDREAERRHRWDHLGLGEPRMTLSEPMSGVGEAFHASRPFDPEAPMREALRVIDDHKFSAAKDVSPNGERNTMVTLSMSASAKTRLLEKWKSGELKAAMKEFGFDVLELRADEDSSD